MNRSDVQEWLDRYVEAWRANDPSLIRGLFAEDAVYRYRPYGDARASRGHAEIVEAWLDDADEPGSWEARYEPYVVEDDRAVAVGFSRYFATGEQPEQTYHNVFLLRFAPDGRCAEFTELWMLEEES